MCRTITESFTTFLFSSTVAIILLCSKEQFYRSNGIIIFAFCGIQLVDTLIHYGLQTHNPSLNLIVSKYMLPTILYLEIPIIYYAVYLLTKRRMIWFEILMVIGVISAFVKHILTCNKISIPGNNQFLVWCQHKSITWYKLVFLLGFYLAGWNYPNTLTKWAIYALGTITYIMTFNNNSFGSGWCHYANIISVILLLFFVIKIR